MEDVKIDWGEVRRRIAGIAIVAMPPKKVGRRKLVPGTPEHAEYRRREAERQREYYATHKEEVRARRKAWEKANPDKVKAKKHRYYEAHKDEIALKKKERKAKDPQRYKELRHEERMRAKARRLQDAA